MLLYRQFCASHWSISETEKPETLLLTLMHPKYNLKGGVRAGLWWEVIGAIAPGPPTPPVHSTKSELDGKEASKKKSANL